jgi:hypothetical protein
MKSKSKHPAPKPPKAMAKTMPKRGLVAALKAKTGC